MVNNLDVSFLDPDRDQPRKYQLVHRDDPKLCPKSIQRCKHCRIAFNATDILLVKAVGVREITARQFRRKSFVVTYTCTTCTKCLGEYDLNFNFKMVSAPKRTQEKLPEGGPEQIRKNGMILD